MGTLAGVAELADALVLGTSSKECGFESLRPHEVLQNRFANVRVLC